ncbi:polysaccharide pyruvyl transferase family protein [Vibrio algivorus]|uniref:Polysaccharide pyruvyl transferase domain-containing protein n=1 Tax=Vibrio algivorus TaxID=1667024 RepID=A0ABQ6EK83_9VIBR|nr:polysaccharide pyruvyl transferase family protein [Vibrio algivorus]GLT13171.1 hypothetical protein GCM10007931_01450 [Vibrio algivorus]
MIIELKGVEFENKGAELMLRVIIERVERYWPEAEIAMLPTVNASYQQRASIGAWQKFSFRKLYFDLNELTYMFPNSVKRLLRKWGVVTEADIDVVIDASGFAYSDQWSPKITVRHLAGEINRYAKHGKPYIFMPQAMGPFSQEKVRKQIRDSFPKAALVCARESQTYEYLSEIFGETDNLKIYGDFTNAISGKIPEDIPRVNAACIIVNKNMVSKKNSVKGWAENYERIVKQIIGLYKKCGLSPYFLNHEGPDDRALIDKINAQLEIPLPVLEYSDPLEVKGAISQASAVFCSRFHGCISALSNGIPCLGTSWSHKYNCLYDSYSAQDLLLSPDMSNEELKKIVEYSILSESCLKSKVTDCAQKFKLETENLWELIVEVVECYQSNKGKK